MFSEIGEEDSRQKGLIFAAMPLVTTIVRFVLVLWVLMSLGGDVLSQEVNVPFGLTVDLESAAGGTWNLVLDLDIGRRDWVVSSYSTDSMFGKVALRFEEPHALTLLGPMEEIPLAMGSRAFSQLDIKVIRHDTRMIQTLAIAPGHTEDIHGRVFFVLEPLCTPFETTFTLQLDAQKGWRVVKTGSRDAFPPGHEVKQ